MIFAPWRSTHCQVYPWMIMICFVNNKSLKSTDQIKWTNSTPHLICSHKGICLQAKGIFNTLTDFCNCWKWGQSWHIIISLDSQIIMTFLWNKIPCDNSILLSSVSLFHLLTLQGGIQICHLTTGTRTGSS